MSTAGAASFRYEYDSMGEVKVDNTHYWGAQTQRSLKYFGIGEERIPLSIVYALAICKKCAAHANYELGQLTEEKCILITQVVNEILSGQHDEQFPLHVWMTGSGTQSNMNMNEVISNRASELAGNALGSKCPLHPNDDVNRSQSSNCVFPSAMNIAVAQQTQQALLPALRRLEAVLKQKSEAWKDIVKVGRTHMQDAVPLTLGQEFFGYAGLITDNLRRIEWGLQDVYVLAFGGTAVGTGMNTPPRFAEKAVAQVKHCSGLPFVSGENKFALQGSHDALVMYSGVLRTLANSLYKIANDIRLLSCGPRAGLFELKIPQNEPGSSIMPGKSNPTQCEALSMVATQVMGNDVTVGFAGAGGSLEMNVYKPVMAYNLLQSIHLLADAMQNFTVFLLEGVEPNAKKVQEYVDRSLMLVTALVPVIGYDEAVKLAYFAYEHDLSLQEANEKLKILPEQDLLKHLDPKNAVFPMSSRGC